jgi:hypothetical protein
VFDLQCNTCRKTQRGSIVQIFADTEVGVECPELRQKSASTGLIKALFTPYLLQFREDNDFI